MVRHRGLRRDVKEVLRGLIQLSKDLFLLCYDHRIIENHSAHRVCTDHNPTQALPPHPYIFYPLIPLTYASQDTKDNFFSTANQPNPHIFGLWEETGAPGGNPRRHEENVQTPHRQ